MSPPTPDLKIETMPIDALRPYPRNARRHSKAQIRQIADSIRCFGFTNPVLVSDDNEIIAGHGRVQAARLLTMVSVPVLRLSHLNEAERRAYVLADNKLALNAGWDSEILAIELQGLIDLDFDATLTGFTTTEIDLALDAARDADAQLLGGPEDLIPALANAPVSRLGDIWNLGRHRLMCGDARNAEHYKQLLDGKTADLIFTDPPYNVPIDGHVSGLGRVRHREFAMAVGEMTEAAFTEFLATTLGRAAAVCRDGTIAFVCMDWRHLEELMAAGRQVFTELKNLCVWNKTNGGMGTFYRSKHELIAVYKVGKAPHINNFGLGESGRYRTNVWDYAGISSLTADRAESLAIRDCSKRGHLVLDPFAGSGTTLIAAETCGRSARTIEYDPLYCDVTVQRYERLTGKAGILAADGTSFESRRAREAAEVSEV